MKQLHIIAVATAADGTVKKAEKILPYQVGCYDLGKEYPFCKNVWETGDSGFSFGHLSVDENGGIQYTGDYFSSPEEKPIEVSKVFCDETIEVNISVK
ncbi:MAG: hypothetical protein ACI396_01905 [Acutalibacteraceae bacterium]